MRARESVCALSRAHPIGTAVRDAPMLLRGQASRSCAGRAHAAPRAAGQLQSTPGSHSRAGSGRRPRRSVRRAPRFSPTKSLNRRLGSASLASARWPALATARSRAAVNSHLDHHALPQLSAAEWLGSVRHLFDSAHIPGEDASCAALRPHSGPGAVPGRRAGRGGRSSGRDVSISTSASVRAPAELTDSIASRPHPTRSLAVRLGVPAASSSRRDLWAAPAARRVSSSDSAHIATCRPIGSTLPRRSRPARRCAHVRSVDRFARERALVTAARGVASNRFGVHRDGRVVSGRNR